MHLLFELVLTNVLSIFYFTSSAAAHNKLNNNDQALNDCFRSIEIDPNYSKAYGRLGYFIMSDLCTCVLLIFF
jgi:small glutamine-rich tetratricopeptide repeat-containing protein alpha